MILSDYSPTVTQELYVPFPGIDHGFNGDSHALQEFHTGIWQTVMKDLRIFVKATPNSMAAILSDHGKSVFLDVGLDGSPDIA
jgi:hypothetical protein